MKMTPYLSFNGECEAAFRFYEKLFNGNILAMMPHEGSPAEEHTPPEWQKKILHACMTIGDQTLMASDMPSSQSEPMQGFNVAVQLDTPAEANRIFDGLTEGGTVTVPMTETFFAHCFGVVNDRFGTPWMILCPKSMGEAQ
ncbi:MAG: VOC family protein [Phyllobacterium sp.]